MNIGKIKQLTENGFRDDKKKPFNFNPDLKMEIKTKKAYEKGIAHEHNRWLADIDELLKVVEDNLEHGPLTESERGWKNALLSLKARRTEVKE